MPTATPITVCFEEQQYTFEIDDVVKRGPTWKWQDQDYDASGNQITGKVVDLYPQDNEGFSISVKWENGSQNEYRVSNLYLDVIPVTAEGETKKLAQTTNNRDMLILLLERYLTSHSATYYPAIWLRPNVLLPALFQRRLILRFDSRFVTAEHTFNVPEIADAYLAMYPDKTANEIVNKIQSHAWLNDVNWARLMRWPNPNASSPGSAASTTRVPLTGTARRRTSPYIMGEVQARDYAYGTINYTEERTYCADVPVPESVVQDAVENDNPQIIVDYINDVDMTELDDDPQYGEMNYGDTNQEGSEDYEITTEESEIRSQAEILMDLYRENNPAPEEE